MRDIFKKKITGFKKKEKPCENSGIRHVKRIRVISKSKLLGFVGDLLAVVTRELKKKFIMG